MPLLPASYNNMPLPAYRPQRYGNMLKFRAISTNELTRISFELTTVLKKKGGRHLRHGVRWSKAQRREQHDDEFETQRRQRNEYW